MKVWLYNKTDIQFQKAAIKFKLIEEDSINVVVCWENSMDIIQQILDHGPSYSLMRRLSKYTVGIYMSDFKTLKDIGVICEKKEGLFVVDYKQQYDKHIGLRTDNNWANEILIQ